MTTPISLFSSLGEKWRLRADTVEGLVALQLAARIENPATTGSAVAALTRELAAAMERALAGVKVEADRVADFEARRAARAAGQ